MLLMEAIQCQQNPGKRKNQKKGHGEKLAVAFFQS